MRNFIPNRVAVLGMKIRNAGGVADATKYRIGLTKTNAVLDE